MDVNEHPVLIIDSTNLHYDIIFGADFLKKCGITLDYDANHNVAFDQHHLSLDQRCNLFNILSKHKKLFDESLRVYPYKKVCIDLKPSMLCHIRSPNLCNLIWNSCLFLINSR